jgi:multidrug resistance efflux pump
MDRPTLPPTPARPRRPALLWLAGVLLAASAALTAWALTSRAGDGNGAAPAATRPEGRVACFGHCDLEYGVTPLYPLQSGRVVAVQAHDGDRVKKGAPLFALDAAAAEEQLKQARADAADADIQLKLARTAQDQHREKIAAQQHAVEAKGHAAAAARAVAAKARRLADNKQIGEGYKEEATAAEEQAKAAEEDQQAEEAKLRVLQAVDPALDVARAEQAVAAKQAQVKRAEIAVNEYTVTAPADGEVLRVLVTPGEALGPNPRQPAVQFAADGPRIIRAEVEQEFASRVALHQSAAVHDDSSSGPIWRGHVSRVSDWYTHRRSMILEPLQLNDVRTLECIITLDSDQPPLRIGQRVRVTLEGGG